MRWLVIGLLLIVGAGCSQDQRLSSQRDIPLGPPALFVSAGDTSLTVFTGGFEWTVGDRSVTTDAASPQQAADRMQAEPVDAGAELSLSFSYEPKSYEVQLLGQGSASAVVNTDRSTVTAPLEPGEYAYHLLGRWDQGEANYVWKIEVN